MASGELPRWGDGSLTPRMTDAKETPYPTVAADAFDPAVRDGLVAFFRKALHRDTARRFPELKPMRDAWKKIFLDAQQTAPSSHRSQHPVPAEAGSAPAAARIADAEPLTAEEQRDRQAAEVTLETHLSAAGFTAIAESFLYGLDVTTVGGLLEYSQRSLVNRPGLGPKTRTQIQRRVREWNERLRQAPVSPLSPEGRKAAKEQLDELNGLAVSTAGSAVAGVAAPGDGAQALQGMALRAISLDTLATLFVPELRKNGSNANEVEMVRLLLRLPDEHGELPAIGVWPMRKDLAGALGLSAGRIPQMVKTQRVRWKKHPAVKELRTEILELLAESGRVASAAEIADALAVRRGTMLPGREQRRTLALAVVRAVVEVEQLDLAEAEFRHQPNRGAKDDALGAGLLALEVREDDAPDTPSAPGLLDYAHRLGRTADRLARQETLPTAATVLAELGAVTSPPGTVEWDERRMVELAAAASTNAAVTPRLEVYPRDLPLVRALRLTQAGLVRIVPGVPEPKQPGLTGAQIHERVRARFPELVTGIGEGGHDLPLGAPLTRALHEAGFDLTLATHPDTGLQRYLPARMDPATDYLSTGTVRRQSTHSHGAALYSDDPAVRAAGRAEERLTASAGRDGYRVLTVRQALTEAAVQELAGERLSTQPMSATELFLEEMHALVVPGELPTWDTILEADAAPAASDDAEYFAGYARTAWGGVAPRIEALLAGGSGAGPVLLTDTAVFARYDALGVLDALAEQARQGGRPLWLLVPQPDAAREPRLNTTPVPYQAALGEWIELPDSWVANAHRSGETFGKDSTLVI
jgi:hypothetical protein